MVIMQGSCSQRSLAHDVEARSMADGGCKKEDNTGSTGQKGNEGEEPSHPAVSDQSECVSIADSKGTPPPMVLPTDYSLYLGRSKITH